MILFCDHTSPRLRYVARFILSELFGRELTITTDPLRIKDGAGPVVSYSEVPLPGSFHVRPSGFLKETGVHFFEPETAYLGNLPLLFPVENGEISFDIFAAVFYLISRYEEYLDFEPDLHGRFRAVESFAYKKGFLEMPVVNIWVRRLARSLEDKFPGLRLSLPAFRFIPSVDIDIAWMVKNKGLLRAAGGMGKLLIRGKFADSFRRLRILTGKLEDPFDTYRFIREIHQEDDLRIFMLAGDGKRYNKNNPVKGRNWQNLTRELSASYKVGLHPSYFSTEKRSLIYAEKELMERVSGQTITSSRQHFLRLYFPLTYRRLLKIGIREDYSLGFADRPGFRAGTSYSFNFYDLGNETETSLRVFPFMVMDRSLKDYIKTTPEEAVRIIEKLITVTKTYGGNFIPVWHNDSLSGTGEWKGWKEVYLEMLRLIREKEVEYDQIS